MRNVLRAVVDRLRPASTPQAEEAPDPVGVGFHGDEHLFSVADRLLQQSTHFLETGSYVGDTLHHVARTHPQIACHSCEPSPARFSKARTYTRDLDNVFLQNQTSQDFMASLSMPRLAVPTLWLDAHGYGFAWPLKQEIAWSTSSFDRAHVLIDDFQVPGQPHFGFDEYEQQKCTWDFIRDDLATHDDYRIVYPRYSDRTSKHHPLRGWILISFGFGGELPLTDDDRGRVTILSLAQADELAASSRD